MSNDSNPPQSGLNIDDETSTSTPQIDPSASAASSEVIQQLMEHAVRRATYRDRKKIYELEQKVADAEKWKCPYPGVVNMKKQLDEVRLLEPDVILT